MLYKDGTRQGLGCPKGCEGLCPITTKSNRVLLAFCMPWHRNQECLIGRVSYARVSVHLTNSRVDSHASLILSYHMWERDSILDMDASINGTEAVESSKLKSRPTSPILSYHMRERDFILDTNARKDGIEAVLSQTVYQWPRSKVRIYHNAIRCLLKVISEYGWAQTDRADKKHCNGDGLSRQPWKQCGQEQLVEREEKNKMSAGILKRKMQKRKSWWLQAKQTNHPWRLSENTSREWD